jgi:hypothetical protein
VLLVDEAQVEARFDLFGDSTNLDSRQVHGLHQTYNRFGNNFGRTQWVLLWDEAQVEACFVLFGDSANLDATKVYAERTIDSEIILDAPDGTRR